MQRSLLYRGEHYNTVIFRLQSLQPDSAFHSPPASIKSEYNIGRYKILMHYRGIIVITDNGNLNLEIDYADYKDRGLAQH